MYKSLSSQPAYPGFVPPPTLQATPIVAHQTTVSGPVTTTTLQHATPIYQVQPTFIPEMPQAVRDYLAQPPQPPTQVTVSQEWVTAKLQSVEPVPPASTQMLTMPNLNIMLKQEVIPAATLQPPPPPETPQPQVKRAAEANLNACDMKEVTGGKYQCLLCHKTFPGLKHCSSHVATAHQQVQNKVTGKVQSGQFACTMCDRTYSHRNYLRRHMAQTHLGKGKVYECPICGQRFSTNYWAKHHVQVVHEKQKPHACTQCGEAFTSSNHLERHKVHVHNHESQYKCEVCGRNYYDSSVLNQHRRRVHQEQKAFKCDLCPETFGRSATLLTHVESVHSQHMLGRPPAAVLIAAGAMDPNQMPSATMSTDTVPRLNKYPRGCEVCGKKVRSKMSETLHYKAAHPELPRPVRPDTVTTMAGAPATSVVNATSVGPATVTVAVPVMAGQMVPQQVLQTAHEVVMQQQTHFKQEIQ